MDSWLRQSQEQAETVSDRMVTVTVDARGRLVDLKLTREATDLFPSDLATTILDCVDKARSRAGAKASKIASDAWARSRIWPSGCERPTVPGRRARRTLRIPAAAGIRTARARGVPAWDRMA